MAHKSSCKSHLISDLENAENPGILIRAKWNEIILKSLGSQKGNGLIEFWICSFVMVQSGANTLLPSVPKVW